MVEEFCTVVSDHGDATTWKATGGAIAGPVGHDHANVEAAICILVRVARVARAWRPLKAQNGPSVRRAVLAPRESSTISQRQTAFDHSPSMAKDRSAQRLRQTGPSDSRRERASATPTSQSTAVSAFTELLNYGAEIDAPRRTPWFAHRQVPPLQGMGAAWSASDLAPIR
jgi:hypothetical protein